MNHQSNLAAARFASLSRRHFLRGLGTCIALPAFTSLRPTTLLGAETASTAKLATTATGAPLRSAFVFFPNGAIPSAWWPQAAGSDFEVSTTLKPLETHRQHWQLLGELDHKAAEAGPDGGGDHARGNGVFLTGVRLKKSATDIHAGVSIDQVMANQVGHLTRFPSLELTCDAGRSSGACDSGYACAYQHNLSWSSATTPKSPEANPRMAFERLFGEGPPGQRTENLKRRQQEQRSVLDFVLADARAMERRLSSNDKDKLDQYLTGVREIETRIENAERFGDVKDPGVETPHGIPSDYGQHLQLMYDLLVLAFQTDSTRIATLLLAHDGSNRSFPDIGIPEGHHDLSHHFNSEEKIKKVAEIDLWYAKQFAKFVEKLQNTKDVDGQSLLHNSMIIYGGGNADANRHTHSNLPIILAGAGGGTLTPGRYVKHGSVPTTNLFLSLADRMGLQELERFGDSTGRLVEV
ncbi:MAG TPA: DUF1552 domain-containing protein [Verrucomicrobiota bacterium]|nr:hypothetical protein [Verrucomicrobiales bacterium]HRI12045.1 DUF1552 domain-containing protein [Verrucomicrobiota bacterium]